MLASFGGGSGRGWGRGGKKPTLPVVARIALIGSGGDGGAPSNDWGGSGGGGAGEYKYRSSYTLQTATGYSVIVAAGGNQGLTEIREQSTNTLLLYAEGGADGAGSGGASGQNGACGGGAGGWNGYNGVPGGGTGSVGGNGGSAYRNGGGGGGGMSANGQNGQDTSYGGDGGAGVTCSLSGRSVCGGGGGGHHAGSNPGTATHGGGGGGTSTSGSPATPNSGGGGGGGGGNSGLRSLGASGAVYIEVPDLAASTTGNPNVTSVANGYLYEFLGSGTLTL